MFKKEYLKAQLIKVTANQSESEYVEKMVRNTASAIKRDPLSYRQYGVYWWTLKALMIESKVNWISEAVDVEGIEIADTGNKALNLIAGWLTARSKPDYSPYSTITVGEVDSEYFVYDEEMEKLAI